MKRNFKFTKKALILTVLFLVIMLLKRDYYQGSVSWFLMGWPVPYVVWDINYWPKGFQGAVTLEQLAHDSNVFLVERSLTGLALSFVFWYLVSSTVLILKAIVSRLKENYVKDPQRFVKNLFRTLAILFVALTLIIVCLKIPFSVRCGLCPPKGYGLGLAVPRILDSLSRVPMGCMIVIDPNYHCTPTRYVFPIESTSAAILFGTLWLMKRRRPNNSLGTPSVGK